jgi:hypothetical protein
MNIYLVFFAFASGAISLATDKYSLFLPCYYCSLEIKRYDIVAVSDSITFMPGFGQYGEMLRPRSFRTFFLGLPSSRMYPTCRESERPGTFVTTREVENAAGNML